MKPNDKLPEVIRKQIRKEAKEYSKQYSTATSEVDWYNGATAWAPWKVRFDELQLQLQAQDANVEILLSQKNDLQTQARRMADALGAISDHIKECQNKKIHVNEMAIALTIAQALQQFKGGKEEVTDPCPHCGKKLSRDRNLCCRECGKEVENEL